MLPRARALIIAAMTTVEALTRREREVLHLLALGLTNREIATRLYLSVRTVESHRANLQSKLGVSTRAELVKLVLGDSVAEGRDGRPAPATRS